MFEGDLILNLDCCPKPKPCSDEEEAGSDIYDDVALEDLEPQDTPLSLLLKAIQRSQVRHFTKQLMVVLLWICPHLSS